MKHSDQGVTVVVNRFTGWLNRHRQKVIDHVTEKTVAGASEFAERVLAVLRAAEHDPEALREEDVRAACDHAGSHVYDTEQFCLHLVNVAGIHCQLVEVLLSHTDGNFVSPINARVAIGRLAPRDRREIVFGPNS